MTKQQIKLLEELIADITISRVEPILDDDYPDALADGEAESLQDLVDYIGAEYDIDTSGTIRKSEVLKDVEKLSRILERVQNDINIS